MRGPLENELKTKNNQKQQSVLQFPILQQVQQDLQKLKEKNLQLKRKWETKKLKLNWEN